MKSELKAKWLEALRSGKYNQTKEKLRDCEGFCCLGVLADVVDPNSWSGPQMTSIDKEVMPWRGDLYDFSTGVLEDTIGLTEGEQATLADMNDLQSKTFEEIANYIETYIIPSDD